ncbi:hypothetical protein OSH11_00565 [Kaistia dalseonensis]|uniref:DUF2232 domain-containing protein n=1 Tax=Kaistia dalseonensis TaxID=410840 RepID=A0ABU0H0A7_9HYPH|nr:hypothetical protein [Kaistia dalseonensis]MCX5493186.1 hypothetical protein [Kaistia dalseonensis]MDQ0435741.1 hypothetical protein [Kaistia dalseonensis]
MARNILIGLGAGLAAALLFAALISGTALAFPLFMLSPLPIAIAGLGFGTLSGVVGAALASALIGAAIGPIAGGLYLVLFAAPIAWAAHLIGLSRTLDGEPPVREWFPLDATLLRLSLAVAVAIVIAGYALGYDPETLIDQTLTVIQAWLAQDAGGSAPSRAELEPLVRFNITLMPFTAASLTLGILVLNAWAGARIVKMSGMLQRVWAPVWTVVLPPVAAGALGAALVASFVLPGGIGHSAAAIAGAIGFGFALTGFGCLHALLIGRPLRSAILFVAYALSFVFVLPIALMAALGVADTFFHFRARRFAGRAGMP